MMMRGLDTLAAAMRIRVLAKYLGVFGLALALMAAVPAGAALLLGHAGFAWRAAIVALALAGSGFVLFRLEAPALVRQSEAMAVTALGFALGGAAMAWPFTAAGLPFIDALFESVSAITTTGLSTAGPATDLPRAMLFARAWMQWCGGLAIIILAFVLMLGPGAAARRLTLSDTAPEDLASGTLARGRRLLVVYAGLTAAGMVLLWALGASPFDAAVHALSSLSTGGFSSRDDSVAGLGGHAIQAAVALLFLLGAISFSLQFRAWRTGPMTLLRDGGFLALITAAAVVCLLVILAEWLAGATAGPGLVADAAFLALSAQTTTGFQTGAPADLAPASKLVLIGAMTVGGDVGSTAGGIKIFRLLVILRLLQLLFARTCMPRHAVADTRIGGRSLAADDIALALGIVALFAATILLSWYCFLAAGHDPLDSLFDVASAIGTVGLSTGIAGPELDAPLKFVLVLDMLMGRLEILAVLVLAYPRSWFGSRARAS
ncbi:MAG: TrkH family potassium uptake protein [Rhodospirillales bacterium]|nr:MAG: TrkH family potassium uptake protein [Rhodospirillales bacterium]